MSGDPTNARLWAFADVYVSFDVDEADPANIDADFAGGWEPVGILDGDDGFVTSRDEDVTDHFGWGNVYLKTGRAHFKMSKKFTCLEDNDTTFALVWPASTRGGDIVVPKPVRLKIAFETTEGATKQRFICAFQAEVAPDGDVTENETDITKIPLVATIFPDTTEDPAVLFHHQTTESGS